MAPVIYALRKAGDSVRSIVCSTGQHRQMLDDVFQVFDISPDYELSVMQPAQSLSSLTAKLFTELDRVVIETKPDWILAQGDTTSAMVAAMTAYYHKIPFGHVEAGLRTRKKYYPFPEEINRIIADEIAELMFAPTTHARQHLISGGFGEERVITTGNTVIDALYMAAQSPYSLPAGPLAGIPFDKKIVLVTAHRRESFGRTFEQIMHAIGILAERFAPEGLHFVYPVHLNPLASEPAHRILGKINNVTLLRPLDYLSLVNLMCRATIVMTDSGGIQEEAPAFGKPVLVLRNETERPEGVIAGCSRLVGTSTAVIVDAATELLTNQQAYDAMARAENPYGDGKAAERILRALMSYNRQGS